MSIQPAAIESATARIDPEMNSRSTHAEEILRNDISWLESRIQRLEAAGSARERKLSNCYQNLLRQRQRQLASRGSQDGVCLGCWQDTIG